MPELALVPSGPVSKIVCDHAGCGAYIASPLDLTPLDAAALAINRGWSVRHVLTHDEHYCYEHDADALVPREVAP